MRRIKIWSKSAVRTCQNYSKQIVSGDRKGIEIVLGTVEKKDHEYCLRCGRRLRNPVARMKGYGAICEKKMKEKRNLKLFR